ncbi:MAG: adenosine deaminase [Pseudomonadota bacterium]
MENISKLFIEALKLNSLELLRQIPKSDLHNHGLLGGRLDEYKKWQRCNIPKPPNRFYSFKAFTDYVDNEIAINFKGCNLQDLKQKITFLIESAFREARKDSIKIFDMSVDVSLQNLFHGNIKELIKFLSNIHKKIAPQIIYRPCLGIIRTTKLEEFEKLVFSCIESGFFKSIDLYGDEYYGNIKSFRKIFQRAKQAGLKLKMHAGEFRDASYVIKCIETLEIDEIQHGISTAKSLEAMKYLYRNKIRLNICPTSNIKLNRIKNYAIHPIRILYDNGVNVTINSDDIMIFNQCVSEEYLNLFNADLFSANELDNIRITGLDH